MHPEPPGIRCACSVHLQGQPCILHRCPNRRPSVRPSLPNCCCCYNPKNSRPKYLKNSIIPFPHLSRNSKKPKNPMNVIYETQRIQQPQSLHANIKDLPRETPPGWRKGGEKKTRKTASWNAYCQWQTLIQEEATPTQHKSAYECNKTIKSHSPPRKCSKWALHSSSSSSSSSQHCCHQWSDRIYDRITLDLQFDGCGKQLSWHREREREREREERERARESARDQ